MTMALTRGLPTISVVVPSFNQGRFLGKALASIFAQNYERVEVVVMDGGSTDQSVDIVRSYASRLKHWQSRPDGGQAEAINEGMRHCGGELVAWLNSDDFYLDDAFWTVGRAYSASPDRGLYIGNGLRYNELTRAYRPFCRRHLALHRTALAEGLDYILQPATFFLRRAWEDVGGLNSKLCFCLDWDVVIRIAERNPAVLVNDFLAVSREYEDTKTGSGKMSRAIEIAEFVHHHAKKEVTPGSLYYLLETLLEVTDSSIEAVRPHMFDAMSAIRRYFADAFGNDDGFPEIGDARDTVFLPIATQGAVERPADTDVHGLPSISIVTPSFNQARFLGATLESILGQDYPQLETIVFDAGSTDGSIEILRRFGDRLTHWVSEPDRGPAHAINKGFKIATGEVLGWLNSDDLLACDALRTIGRAFAEDPELDMVYANALYIDEDAHPYLADHGTHRTALYYGEMQPWDRVPAYWSYVHAVPQPTVFFRRRLLDTCGDLSESYQYIFDFELFWRFARRAKIRKIERTLAFYRIHAASKTSNWNAFLVELYRFSRPRWPRLRSPEYRHTFRSFLGSYMARRVGARPHDFCFWTTAAMVGLSALTRIGNPEAFRFRRGSPSQRSGDSSTQSPSAGIPQAAVLTADARPSTLQPPPYTVDTTTQRYRSLFCSFDWPRHPGHSGGEIRDFHLLRRLLSLSAVQVFALRNLASGNRQDLLSAHLTGFHTLATLQSPRFDCPGEGVRPLDQQTWIDRALRRHGLPALRSRYHADVTDKHSQIFGVFSGVLQAVLRGQQPDFLFVSPQLNPIALGLDTAGLRTRLIMASYDVEAVRMRRMAESRRGLARVGLTWEARRAERFERENLSCYDALIAVSDRDQAIFVTEYGFTSDRVLVIENGVDPNYFNFIERQAGRPADVVFVGALSYPPNQQAAWRLLRRIMPRVRQHYPQARLSLVGQGPEPSLLAQDDGEQTVVTGTVHDVRPYLGRASVACIPLLSGSGTKYKVLEALSAGVPTVGSPLAVEGLDLEHGQHLLVGESDDELAAAIVRLLDQPDLARSLAQQGRQLVERRYAWDVNLARLDNWLVEMAALPRRSERPASRSKVVQGYGNHPT